MSKKISFSIITPTYNRGHLLQRVAKSLTIQKEGLISEWIIIDDGSIDDTKKIIDDLKNALSFKIKYKYHKNMGVGHSHNLGMSLVKSNFFFKIDSDDYLLPGALEHISDCINEFISPANNKKVYAYSFPCRDIKNRTINNISVLKDNAIKHSDLYYLGNYTDIRISGILKGDLLDVFPSSPVLDHFRFGMYSTEKCNPTGFISMFLADYCKTYVCYSTQSVLVKDYQDTGISKSKLDSLDALPRAYLFGTIWELILTRDNFMLWQNSLRRLLRTTLRIIILDIKYNLVKLFLKKKSK